MPYSNPPCSSRYDGNSLLSSIESYDPVIDSWEVVTSMAIQRCDAGVCVLREKWCPRTYQRKSRLEDRQLDFVKMPLKQNQKGRRLNQVLQFELPLQDGQRSTSRTVRQRFSLTLVDFISKEPIITCMTLRWYLCLPLSVRLFFQFVFKVQYIFLLIKRKLWSRFQTPVAAICLITLAYIIQRTFMLPPIWLMVHCICLFFESTHNSKLFEFFSVSNAFRFKSL